MQNYPGYFISAEGGDGSGKTTVLGSIETWLENRTTRPVTFSFEPGGSRIGKIIRDTLHNMKYTEMTDETELLLYVASRAQFVHEIVIPALEEGHIVVTDRYADSSIAYQGVARELGIEFVRSLNQFATKGITPNTTILFNVDAQIGLQRRKKGEGEWNRLDAQKLDFHQAVIQAYLDLAHSDPTNRWEIIDANQSLEEVIKETKHIIETRLHKAGFMERQTPSPERR